MAERSFGWVMAHRRLARDHEDLPASSEAMIPAASIGNLTKPVTDETTPIWLGIYRETRAIIEIGPSLRFVLRQLWPVSSFALLELARVVIGHRTFLLRWLIVESGRQPVCDLGCGDQGDG
jgi:hypothetical protein